MLGVAEILIISSGVDHTQGPNTYTGVSLYPEVSAGQSLSRACPCGAAVANKCRDVAMSVLRNLGVG